MHLETKKLDLVTCPVLSSLMPSIHARVIDQQRDGALSAAHTINQDLFSELGDHGPTRLDNWIRHVDDMSTVIDVKCFVPVMPVIVLQRRHLASHRHRWDQVANRNIAGTYVRKQGLCRVKTLDAEVLQDQYRHTFVRSVRHAPLIGMHHQRSRVTCTDAIP